MTPSAGGVVFSRIGRLARITLNRPRALNALTLDMIRAIDAHLASWTEDHSVSLVLIDGAGDRGLCAGGDIRALYDAVCAGDFAIPADFFREEYRLNARIARYPKPFVAFMDGIVMGGGIGVSAHGTFRVVTERSRLAMPEAGIGFVPDVGGSWLLSHASNEFGTHAALTSTQLGAADALACGLADICVTSDSLPLIIQALAVCDDTTDIRTCFAAYAAQPAQGVLEGSSAWMSTCYGQNDVECILACLDNRTEPGAHRAARDIRQKSPTSLKVTLRALRQARSAPDLEHALEMEYRLAMAFMRAPDFREGVRAAVVDKDRKPAWSPASLSDVSPAHIDSFFNPPGFGGLGLVAD